MSLLGPVEEWFLQLDEHSIEAVANAIDMLEQYGPTLGRPTVDRVKRSKLHNMKELRPAATNIRILFAFDPKRQAILLVAGDKTGNWSGWYTENIPIAERRFQEWLDGEHDEEG
ncbi:type II toxin-antitoxin system RelE/ParE family toxin [Nocardia farcinica]|uniref:type II toxin-antitoxin system RelE/ParE family toxin n=1 Tax=Nocardia farcinica TaxID=37329 RepID=UPI000C019DC0|nr:type II toxin-antitoxin system RelE/ParE family toxin [Nocardia farcinica]PFX02059.1 putative toxin HigB2 [Nocardia farcinica]PFX04587.1 putative toxin HigB2 [Nocardia farcinica]